MPGNGRCVGPTYEALGDAAPDGPILGIRVCRTSGSKRRCCLTTPRCSSRLRTSTATRRVLVLLENIDVPELEELMVEAWLDRAPKRLAKDYLEKGG